MTTATFDTLGIVKRLEERGFPREQAEVLAQEFAEARKIDLSPLATKADVTTAIELLRRDLKLDIGKMLALAVGILGGLMIFKFLL